MIDSVSQNKTEIEHRANKGLAIAGFALWWAVLVAVGYAPAGDEAMYALIAAGLYAVGVLIFLFASGYFRATRASFESDQQRKKEWKSYLLGLPIAACIYILLMRIDTEEPWSDTIASAALFILFLAGFTYWTQYRKPKG